MTIIHLRDFTPREDGQSEHSGPSQFALVSDDRLIDLYCRYLRMVFGLDDDPRPDVTAARVAELDAELARRLRGGRVAA